MLDRTIAPLFKKIEKVDIIEAQTESLSNGIKIHSINVAGQPVMRLEFIFKAGLACENIDERMVSYFTLKMLNEGTKNKTTAQINDFFDGYGSFLELNHGADQITITLYCLSKHLAHLLPVMEEILFESVFPNHELENLKNITSQNLAVNNEKTSHLAAQLYKEGLFGKNHPYGKSLSLEVIPTITQNGIINFYHKNILNKPFDIIISGEINEGSLELIKKTFSNFHINKKAHVFFDTTDIIKENKKIFLEKEGSTQSSIRYGKKLFNRTHADYFPMVVLNEILGGYFGSRLMLNIREDKGYTYGIHSSIYSLRQAGYLTIGADVKREFTRQSIDEIIKEIKILQSEAVPADELEKVKNYMLGSFAGGLNSAFAIADHFKLIYFDGLDYDYYKKYIATISNITSEEILAFAQKYLSPESMTEVIVGRK